MTGRAARKSARRQKIARFVSTVRVRVSVSAEIRSRRMSERRTMLSSPRHRSMATNASAIDHASPRCKKMYVNAKVDAPTKSVKIQKMITAGYPLYVAPIRAGPGGCGESGGGSSQYLHADRQRVFVDSESR